MSNDSVLLKIENKEIEKKLLDLAKRSENLRPLMKNIAGIFASSTEENFKNEGRPDKWTDLKDITKAKRKKINKWSGQILQVSGKLAASVTTLYDDNSAVIGSNLDYARIHQLGGEAGINKSVKIMPRPYILITDDEQNEIINIANNFLKM